MSSSLVPSRAGLMVLKALEVVGAGCVIPMVTTHGNFVIPFFKLLPAAVVHEVRAVVWQQEGCWFDPRAPPGIPHTHTHTHTHPLKEEMIMTGPKDSSTAMYMLS